LNSPLLVVGYGNELLGDDAAGIRVAENVQRWGLPYIQALAVRQLLPELAESIAAARAVFFVDAALPGREEPVTVTALLPGEATRLAMHFSDPRDLLTLTQNLHGRCPPAWLVTVAATQFEIGHGLSETSRRGVAAATELLRRALSSASQAPGDEVSNYLFSLPPRLRE
jgi:hydrogenase maturation protease